MIINRMLSWVPVARVYLSQRAGRVFRGRDGLRGSQAALLS